VTVELQNLTRHHVFHRTLFAPAIDVSSAEWIVEAPSECFGARCRVLPLSSFAPTTFTSAHATSTTGHTGTIADPLWANTTIDLQPDGPQFGGPHGRDMSAAAAATTGALSTSGGSFTVTTG
jgi:hypothetical protein